MSEPTPGNAATLRTVKLTELVLDPALQCRAGMNEQVISDYTAHLADGGTLPPGRAIEVDGKLYLVDGWHRYRAHEKVQLYATTEQGGTRMVGRDDRTIEVEVVVGDRRAAQLAAVRANSDHGLPRTMDDKRKAVRTLLMDGEWCKLSGRELGKLAAVSHTFVDERRKAYGVKAGSVLKDADIQRVDGEPSAAWRALLAEATETWYRNGVEACRIAVGPVELLAASTYDEIGQRARELRKRELATEEWPWPEDYEPPTPEARRAAQRARLARLDTVEDLVKAARVAPCWTSNEEREAIYKLIEAAQRVPGAKESYQIEPLRKQLAGRPKLLARLDANAAKAAAAREKREGKAGTDPYSVAKRIMELTDAEEQRAAVEAADDQVFGYLTGPKLQPAVRDGVYRQRSIGDADFGTCVRPSCRGWLRKDRWNGLVCGACNTEQARWKNDVRRALDSTAQLLAHEGFGVVSKFAGIEGVTIDRAGVRLLQAIEDAGTGEAKATVLAWLKKAPLGINTQALAFLKRTPAAFTQVEPPEPESDLHDGSMSEAWNKGWAAYQVDKAAGNRELEPEAPEGLNGADHEDWLDGYVSAQDEDREDEEDEEGGGDDE